MTTEYQIITDTNNPLCGKTYEEVLEIIKKRGLWLCHVQTQTTELCVVAITQNSDAIGWVIDQQPFLCKMAIHDNPMILGGIENQTTEICIEAVKLKGRALMLVKEQTAEICKFAIEQNLEAVEYVSPMLQKELGIILLAKHLFTKLFYYQGKYIAQHKAWEARELLENLKTLYYKSEIQTLFSNAIIEHEKTIAR